MTFLEKLDRLLEQRHLNRSSLSAKAGIPYTTIEIDPQNTSYEQVRTRIQTFCEML